ncbi:hypothetical protein BY458DRAFT_516524 [Sporodiniella umbellata]|nr:hypothetical protein BY458DRAFT_516524 [Sporodiniella umbellata]
MSRDESSGTDVASPSGRRYMKPVHGIQTKGFARSAQRRSSVLTLGSIERLQHFYAKRDLKTNKGGTLGFNRLTEEEEEAQLPTPQAPRPSWVDLDVETDLDVLLHVCYDAIQHTLSTWSMVVQPPRDEDAASVPVLPLIASVTKMLDAVRNYTMHRHDLSDAALTRLRHSALSLLQAMRGLETQSRETQDNQQEGYKYRPSDFHLLASERQAIHAYLRTVQQDGFNPPHHIGSPPAVFSPAIRALMDQTSPPGIQLPPTHLSPTETPWPLWLQSHAFQQNPLCQVYALCKDAQKRPSMTDPAENEDAFLEDLSDGSMLCYAYNYVVQQSKRPFGFITHIHADTRRTYRAVENLRFFAAACKFRFELVLDPFDPSEIVRKTDRGLSMIKQVSLCFCQCAVQDVFEKSIRKKEE